MAGSKGGRISFDVQKAVNAFFDRYLGGTRFYKFLLGVSQFYWFTRRVVLAALSIHKTHLDAFLRVTINQVKFTGAKALPLVSVIALTVGGATIINALTFLPRFGANDFIGNLLSLVIVRGVGPLITAIIILTRSGSAIAAELSTQKLHGEIEAIEMMGINPIRLMVIPRVIGGLIATSLLIIYFDFIAFIGGFAISSLFSSFPFSSYLEAILASLSISDILSTILQATIYGITIPLTCCYYGFHPTTLYEIPIFVSKAVVRSLFAIFVLYGLITAAFYL